MDFIYYGETNFYQDNLDTFLAIAEEFQLKGLTRGKLDEKETLKKENQNQRAIPNNFSGDLKEFESLTGKLNEEEKGDETQAGQVAVEKENKPSKQTGSIGELPPREKASDSLKQPDNLVAIPNYFSPELKELDEKVNSMMHKNENLTPTRHICKVCGKEGYRSDIKKHIEAKHLDGVSIPCNLCEKNFKSRRASYEHELKYHK